MVFNAIYSQIFTLYAKIDMNYALMYNFYSMLMGGS